MQDGGIPKSEYFYNHKEQGNIEDLEVYRKTSFKTSKHLIQFVAASP
jgi:hypothetical protein